MPWLGPGGSNDGDPSFDACVETLMELRQRALGKRSPSVDLTDHEVYQALRQWQDDWFVTDGREHMNRPPSKRRSIWNAYLHRVAGGKRYCQMVVKFGQTVVSDDAAVEERKIRGTWVRLVDLQAEWLLGDPDICFSEDRDDATEFADRNFLLEKASQEWQRARLRRWRH